MLFQVRTPEGESRDRALVSDRESQGILTHALLDPRCVRFGMHDLVCTEDSDQIIARVDNCFD